MGKAQNLKVSREVGIPRCYRQPLCSHEGSLPRMRQPKSEFKRGALTQGTHKEMEQKLRSHLSWNLFSLEYWRCESIINSLLDSRWLYLVVQLLTLSPTHTHTHTPPVCCYSTYRWLSFRTCIVNQYYHQEAEKCSQGGKIAYSFCLKHRYCAVYRQIYSMSVLLQLGKLV